MSEALTILVSSIEEKAGETDGRPWTKYAIKDGNGDYYSTFDGAIVQPARELTGKKAEIKYELKGKFRNLLSVKPHEEAAEKPALGTGEYVKGQSATPDVRGMTAAVALEAAVTQLGPGASYADTANRFHQFFLLLTRKRGEEFVTEQDEVDSIPFEKHAQEPRF